MQQYNLRIDITSSHAVKFIRRSGLELQRRIKDALLAIQATPSIGRHCTGDLRGVQIYALSQRRQHLRIAYRLHSDSIEVIAIGPRENFYRSLKRRRT
ncbi:MAG: type II toxin-antitoxin system RelE/ParE family toxin [Litorivicinus sp.]